MSGCPAWRFGGAPLPWKLWSWGCRTPSCPRLACGGSKLGPGGTASPGVTNEYVSWPVEQHFFGFPSDSGPPGPRPTVSGRLRVSEPQGEVRDSLGASWVVTGGLGVRPGLPALRNQGLPPPNPDLPLLLKNQPVWKPGPHSCTSWPPHCLAPLLTLGRLPGEGPPRLHCSRHLRGAEPASPEPGTMQGLAARWSTH